jgi:methylglutaconyl-CoA hydratase
VLRAAFVVACVAAGVHAPADRALDFPTSGQNDEALHAFGPGDDAQGEPEAVAAFCDLRVGAADSRFRMPEVVLGVPPAWGGILDRLHAESGQAAVREALLTAEPFDAHRAQEMSLLPKVVPRHDLEAAVTQWVKPAIRRDPATLRITKEMLNARASAARLSVGAHYEPAMADGTSTSGLAPTSDRKGH